MFTESPTVKEDPRRPSNREIENFRQVKLSCTRNLKCSSSGSFLTRYARVGASTLHMRNKGKLPRKSENPEGGAQISAELEGPDGLHVLAPLTYRFAGNIIGRPGEQPTTADRHGVLGSVNHRHIRGTSVDSIYPGYPACVPLSYLP